MERLLSLVEGCLKKGNVKEGLEAVRSWLLTARPGDPKALLQQCTPSLRPKLALLLRDLLSSYPSTIVGCPVMVYPLPDSTGRPTANLKLPFPLGEACRPCSDLHFMGWLTCEEEAPLGLPFRPERHKTELPWNEISTVVALFRSHPGVFELDNIELPPLWWGELFLNTEGNIHLSARLVLPYPDALEASRILQASARGDSLPEREYFLSDNAWSWALNEGILFHESCRQWSTNP